MTTVPKCLLNGCDEAVAARGLCLPHYQRARDLVTSGRTSWEKLTKLGFVAPRRKAETCHDFDAALFTPEERAARAVAVDPDGSRK